MTKVIIVDCSKNLISKYLLWRSNLLKELLDPYSLEGKVSRFNHSSSLMRRNLLHCKFSQLKVLHIKEHWQSWFHCWREVSFLHWKVTWCSLKIQIILRILVSLKGGRQYWRCLESQTYMSYFDQKFPDSYWACSEITFDSSFSI